MAINEGSLAPDFAVVSDDNTVISSNDFRGKKNVVLYFYPKDNTPGCTQESKDFQELQEAFENTDTQIIGISKDSVASHVKFRDKFDLKFPLLSDSSTEMMQAFDAWGEKSMFGKKYMGCIRSTVLINKEGVVVKHWPKVSVKGHVKKVLEAASAL